MAIVRINLLVSDLCLECVGPLVECRGLFDKAQKLQNIFCSVVVHTIYTISYLATTHRHTQAVSVSTLRFYPVHVEDKLR